MQVWASKKLSTDGELLWERDIWNGSQMMELWMDLITLQLDGFDFADMESILNDQGGLQ